MNREETEDFIREHAESSTAKEASDQYKRLGAAGWEDPELPEYEIRKLRLDSGDILVLRNAEYEISADQAFEIEVYARRILKLGPEFRFLVCGRGWDVSKVTGEELKERAGDSGQH